MRDKASVGPPPYLPMQVKTKEKMELERPIRCIDIIRSLSLFVLSNKKVRRNCRRNLYGPYIKISSWPLGASRPLSLIFYNSAVTYIQAREAITGRSGKSPSMQPHRCRYIIHIGLGVFSPNWFCFDNDRQCHHWTQRNYRRSIITPLYIIDQPCTLRFEAESTGVLLSLGFLPSPEPSMIQWSMELTYI